jgi:hypothetical protein
MNKETSATLRNKLQPIKTALELMAQGKAVPKGFARLALKKLREIEQGLKKGECV